MTTRAFQKIYTKIDNITKATVTLRAQGVGNDELATVGGKLAQVVKIMGENVTLQVFAGTEGLATDSEVVFHGEPPKLRVSDNLAGRFFNAYGEPLDGKPVPPYPAFGADRHGYCRHRPEQYDRDGAEDPFLRRPRPAL